MNFLEENYDDPSTNLFYSQMNSNGQLTADLALSDDSDDDEEELFMAKRPKLEEDLDTM